MPPRTDFPCGPRGAKLWGRSPGKPRTRPWDGRRAWRVGAGSINGGPSSTSRIGGLGGSIGRARGRRAPAGAPSWRTERPGRPCCSDVRSGRRYLEDYQLRWLRTLDTARGRVANLRAVFGGWRLTAITTETIRTYQQTRRTAEAAAATVNRETSALNRMFHLAVRAGRIPQRQVFPERLPENGPRQ